MSESAPLSRENIPTFAAVALAAAILSLAFNFFLLRQHLILRGGVAAFGIRDAATLDTVREQQETIEALRTRLEMLEATVAELQTPPPEVSVE